MGDRRFSFFSLYFCQPYGGRTGIPAEVSQSAAFKRIPVF